MSGTARALASALTMLALTGCVASTTSSSQALASPTGAPLTATLVTATATWVIVPAGPGGDSLSTFWQLLVFRDGDHRWSLVTPPGVADNGGLVMAGAGSSGLLAGFRPSQGLTFSPLAATSDDGRTFAPDLLPAALADEPDALAAAPGGTSLALVADGATVLGRPAASGNWRPITSVGAVPGATASQGCAGQHIAALAAGISGTYVGLSCDGPGAVGIFRQVLAGLQRVDVPLPSSLGDARVAVLRLVARGTSIAALLRVSEGSRSMYAAAWGTPLGWSLSAAFAPAGPLVSTAVTASGFGIVTGGVATGVEVSLVGPGSPSWTHLPTPPDLTAAVAVNGRRVDAIAVNATSLIDYRLDSASGRWNRAQVINVPVSVTSSS